MTADPASPFAVETAGLTGRFGETVAVRDLTLKIPVGTTLGFIGPNGAGKTTTIKMLMNLLRITTGEARVLGLDVAVNPVAIRQRVGYVPEQQFIYRWMRVGEAVGFCRSVYEKWNDKLCTELMQLFRLDSERRVKHLSKGAGVKLSLLLALSHEPELLLLDEPMAGRM